MAVIIPLSAASAESARLVPTTEPGWAQFRGPLRDGVSPEKGLLKQWPADGPKVLWNIEGIGNGYSSPLISGDRLYIAGDVGEDLRIFAYDLSGKKQWEATNGKAWKENYPGARATPALKEGRLYHQNAHGRVACLDAANGKEVWAVDLLEKFRGKNITWALSECLLVDDRAVYATAGGSDALMVALDRKTGEVLWKSPALLDSTDQAVETPSYASPILVEFAGRQLLIGVSLRNLFCIDAANGALQWTHRFPTRYSVLAMMPTLVGDRIFMTAPHGEGGRMLRLVAPKEAAGKVGVEEVWETALDTCQGSVIHVNGKLIGSYYGPRKGWAALDAATGKVLYGNPELIKGSALYADERLYLLSENGWMHLLEPTATEFASHGKFRFAEANRNDAWAHPVVYQGRMYLRFHEKLTCFDIRTAATAP